MAAAYLAEETDLLARETAGARGMIAGVSGTGAQESYGIWPTTGCIWTTREG